MPGYWLRVRPKSTTRRKWYKREPVIDNNALVVGKVIDVEKRRGDYYVIVDFKGRTQELLLIGDHDERPLTPHFIREAKADHPTDWYRWQKSSLEDPFLEDQLGGECTVTIVAHASASASADNQQKAVDHFSEVVAFTLADILKDDLIERGEEDSADVQTISKVVRTGRDTFEATITVRLFTLPATAGDLLPKLYLALDDGTGEASFWPDLLRQQGVERVHASSFTLAGWAGSQRVAPVKGRLHLV